MYGYKFSFFCLDEKQLVQCRHWLLFRKTYTLHIACHRDSVSSFLLSIRIVRSEQNLEIVNFSPSEGSLIKVDLDTSNNTRTSYRSGHEGLLSFLKLLSYCRYPKAIGISFEHLQKLCVFTKFGACSSKLSLPCPFQF